jgi:hypothetical protein
MTDRAKRTTISLVMLGFGRSRLRSGRGRHFRTDRRHVEGIGYRVSHCAKCCDRRNQLHQYREQHDWNDYFQPLSHDFSQNAFGILLLASSLVEVSCGAPPLVQLRPVSSYPHAEPTNLSTSELSRGGVSLSLSENASSSHSIRLVHWDATIIHRHHNELFRAVF